MSASNNVANSRNWVTSVNYFKGTGFSIKYYPKILNPFDWFSKPITLVYSHKKTHETVAGAIVTFICLLLIGYDSATSYVKFYE